MSADGPTREEIEAALNGMVREWERIAREGASGSPRDHCRRLLRAARDAGALAVREVRSEATIKAEALREAADTCPQCDGNGWLIGRHLDTGPDRCPRCGWLRARADEIEETA
ncbi:hypothetical protein [uncultured Aeromicrobium sp.]|uniref:hypothetical protein n=1 Tax=uncultured Aeromicrobium sp. TaxID=337820 RepID=UPI0025FD9342|nr:hypothetical protein [uncultured Aeromicrobium sp.]